MGYRSLALVLGTLACWPAPGAAADTQPQPRTFPLKTAALPLSKVLDELRAKSGNAVADRRHLQTDPKITLDMVSTTFWPALDAIAKAASCGVSTYQPDWRVALVEAPPRLVPTFYHGIFRVEAKRISVARADDAGTHLCTVTLSIAWEPRFEPLFLAVGPVRAIFAADNHGTDFKAQTPGEEKISVAGRGAYDLDVSLTAPPRSSPAIKKLEGHMQVTVPRDMLDFSFPQVVTSGTARRQTRDGVSVSVSPVKTASRRWSVEVTIDNPTGNPPLESYQSWLGNNRIYLEKGTGKERKVWRPVPGDELIEKESVNQARILYSFRVSLRDDPGSPVDWTLHYRTPARIAVVDVPYVFKDLPLP